MIKGVGIDIIEVERVKRIVDRGDSFAEKVLTPNEYDQYLTLTEKRKVEYLGGRFGIKEAFSKAWGTGLGKEVTFQDIETLWNEKGAPITTSKIFSGKIFSSIAHDHHEIQTIVILED